MREFETVLPLSALPQPKPPLVAHGDCGACVIGGFTKLTVPGVYAVLKERPGTLTIDDIAQGLDLLLDQGVLDRVVDESPCWVTATHAAHTAFGFTSLSQAPMWYDYVRLAIDAGYYGLCTISFEPIASKPGDTYLGTNHWVLIKGCRFKWEKLGGDVVGMRGVEEIMVSCSVKGDYWIGVREFARLHGGFHILLARPR